MTRAVGTAAFALLFLGGPALAAEEDVRVLVDFESEEELDTLYQEEKTNIELSKEQASRGESSLKVEFSKEVSWPGFHVDKEPYIAGWGEYGKLAFDVYNPLETPVVLSMRFDDAQTVDYQTRAHAGIRLVPGWNHPDILLASLTRENKAAFDVSTLKRVIFFTEGPKETFHLYFDNIRLEKGLSGGPPIEGALFLDFGPEGQAVMEGFRAASEKSVYGAEEGFGFVGDAGEVHGYAGRFPDDLVGDGVGPSRWSSQSCMFRVDRPNGEYVLYLWGNNRTEADGPFAARTWQVTVNGRRIAGEEINAEAFYSEKHLFALMRDDYIPGRDVWETYIRPYWPRMRVEVSVTDGALSIEGNGFEVWALGLVPLKSAGEGDAFVKKVEQARRKAFQDKHCYVEEPALPEPGTREPAFDRAAGLLVWPVGEWDEVQPWSRPGPREQMTPVILKGCPGERLVFTVAVVPVEDTAFQVETTQFRRRGAMLPEDVVSLRHARYFLKAVSQGTYTWRPELLLAGCPERLARGVARWLWFEVAVPDEARGQFAAEVRLSTDKGAFVIPVRLQLQEYRLPATAELPCTFGWYYNTPSSVGYWTRWFPEEKERFERWLDVEFEWMARQGCNSVQIPLPDITSADEKGLGLDFSGLDVVARYMRKYRLGAEHPAQMNVLSIARRIVRSCGYEEYSEGFNRTYQDAVKAIEEWRKSAGIQLVYWVVDEPREQALNPWNRNLEGTLKYLELVRELKLPASVTMMGDENRDVDYMPMVPLQDYIQTHPWPRSVNTVKYWKEHPGQKLWFYNAGQDRLTWGFALYKSGADGFWQWHWRWFDLPYHPFIGVKWGVVYPGPDGPVPTPGYYRVMQGITDYRYMVMAKELLARAPARSRNVRALERAVADVLGRTPDIMGVELESGEAVGEGLKGEALEKAAEARERIASAVAALYRELER